MIRSSSFREPRRLPSVGLVVLLATGPACVACQERRLTSHEGTIAQPAEAPAVRATAKPNPDSCVSARVDIVARNANAVRIRYGPDSGYVRETPWLSVSADGALSTTIIGLEPGAVTHF